MNTIIVEGPDGSGKSTLLKELSKVFNIPVTHTGGPKDVDTLKSQVTLVEDLAREKPCLFDRVPQISEQVYTTIFHRPLGMRHFDLVKSLMSIKPVLIYCRLQYQEEMLDHISLQYKPHKSQEWIEDVRKHHQEIVNRYDVVMKDLEGKVPLFLHYDWQKDSRSSLIFNIKEFNRCAA